MEAELVEWLRQNLPRSERLVVGVGDDAAIVDWSTSDSCLVTSDLLADGVHFRWSHDPPEQIGRKAVAVNLSDLAAMAARPVAIVVSLLLPNGSQQNSSDQVRVDLSSVKRLYAGMLELAEEYGFVIAGGDTNTWAGGLAISVTAFGTCDGQPVTRSGACPGDRLLVTGALGGSRAGHQFEFTPRIREAVRLNRDFEIHAAIDISDGLALDASRLARASGCGIELDLSAIPIRDAALRMHQADPQGPTALARALGDGEDFELLLAAPAADAERMLSDQPLEVPLTLIGKVVPECGLWQLTSGATRIALPATGYLHGFSESL